MTTPLTDASGQKFGDGLALIERVDTVKGEVSGTSQRSPVSDLRPIDRRTRARCWSARASSSAALDNSVYHKGYPVNYREARGTPSIQRGRLRWTVVSRNVDVDYRASRLPRSCLPSTATVRGELGSGQSESRQQRPQRHAARWIGYHELVCEASIRASRVEQASSDASSVLTTCPTEWPPGSTARAGSRRARRRRHRARSASNYGCKLPHRRAGEATPPIALLWAKEDGYWKIVSWQTEPKPDETPVPQAPPEPEGRADQGRPRPRQRGEKLHGHLVDSQELRRGRSIPVDEKLRRATTSCAVQTRRRRASLDDGGTENPRESRTDRPMGWHSRAVWRRSSRLPSRSTRRFA